MMGTAESAVQTKLSSTNLNIAETRHRKICEFVMKLIMDQLTFGPVVFFICFIIEKTPVTYYQYVIFTHIALHWSNFFSIYQVRFMKVWHISLSYSPLRSLLRTIVNTGRPVLLLRLRRRTSIVGNETTTILDVIFIPSNVWTFGWSQKVLGTIYIDFRDISAASSRIQYFLYAQSQNL